MHVRQQMIRYEDIVQVQIAYLLKHIDHFDDEVDCVVLLINAEIKKIKLGYVWKMIDRVRLNVTKHIIGHIGDGFFTGQMTQPTVSKH